MKNNDMKRFLSIIENLATLPEAKQERIAGMVEAFAMVEAEKKQSK